MQFLVIYMRHKTSLSTPDLLSSTTPITTTAQFQPQYLILPYAISITITPLSPNQNVNTRYPDSPTQQNNHQT